MFNGLKNKLTSSMMAAAAMPSCGLAFDDDSFGIEDSAAVVLGVMACVGLMKEMKKELDNPSSEIEEFVNNARLLNGMFQDSYLAEYVKDSCIAQAIRLPHFSELDIKNEQLGFFIFNTQMEHFKRFVS